MLLLNSPLMTKPVLDYEGNKQLTTSGTSK